LQEALFLFGKRKIVRMELFKNISLYIFYIINIVVAAYLVMPVLLFAIHWIIPNRKQLIQKYSVICRKDFDFAAVVTVHQDTRFIAPLVDSFLKQDYPNFIVYVVADDCDIAGLSFDDERIKILKPEPALHAKVHSIKFAVDHFEREHDVIIIFDSDNLVHPQYLKKLNGYFQRGFRAVQTHMLSKNTDSVYARLDSIGHIYNTFMERQVKMELGLSSAILGLGIALETNLYKEIFYKDTLGGFDKKLQAELIKRTSQIAFAEDAIVYDEKVESGTALEKQRTRWIAAYFKYFNENLKMFLAGIRRFNFNQFLFGFTMLRPPLFITLMAAFVLMIGCFFLSLFAAFLWVMLFFLYALVFVLVVITQSRQKGMGYALLHVPKIVFRQILAFTKIKKAKREFLKTEHQQIIYINDLLKNEFS
jgi:cellulose synthase/poly-beta-1,6-N-acetylglucosamine synthase-like glycosyltransferase